MKNRFGRQEREIEQTVRYHLGTNGKIEAETTYYPAENSKAILRYEYDEQGRPTTEYYLLADGSRMPSRSFEYEPDRTLEKEFGLSDNLISATETVFDARKREVEWTVYDKDGKASVRTITAYTTQGKRESTYDDNGALYERREYRFNGSQLNSQATYKINNGEDVLAFVITYVYNADGTKAREVTKDGANRQIDRHVFQYNAKGKKTEDLFEDQNAVSKMTFEYESNGDLVKLSMFEKSTKYGNENWSPIYEIDIGLADQTEPQSVPNSIK